MWNGRFYFWRNGLRRSFGEDLVGFLQHLWQRQHVAFSCWRCCAARRMHAGKLKADCILSTRWQNCLVTAPTSKVLYLHESRLTPMTNWFLKSLHSGGKLKEVEEHARISGTNWIREIDQFDPTWMQPRCNYLYLLVSSSSFLVSPRHLLYQSQCIYSWLMLEMLLILTSLIGW